MFKILSITMAYEKEGFKSLVLRDWSNCWDCAWVNWGKV